MLERKLADDSAPSVGLGCMSFSYAYGNPLEPAAAKLVLKKALDLGVRHFDTAAIYGVGKNEALVGPYLKPLRGEIFLASKCVLFLDGETRTLDGSPAGIRNSVEASLRRLETDYVDLMYLHRLDPKVPVEDSVGELARLKEEGKLKAIGLSEMSGETVRKAAKIHPIAAIQSEYSLWSRNVEIAVLDASREIGAAFVAFSPVARGFLANMSLNPDDFVEKDIRRGMPRFQEPHLSINRENLLPGFQAIAEEVGCTPAQLSIAWILHQADNIHVIPGTTKAAHIEENWGAQEVTLSDETAAKLDQLINTDTVSGPRYSQSLQTRIDTEMFPGEF